MSIEIKSLLEEQGKVFDVFKAKVDAELAGKADAVVTDEIKKLNDALDTIGAKMREVEAKAARPVGDDAERAATLEAKSAFADYARSGRIADGYDAKSVSTAVNADGGFALPKIIDPTMINRLVDISPVRSVARVVRAGGRDFRILVNRRGAASGWVGETAARPETNTPAIQEITPPSGDLYANAGVTSFALNDLNFDVADWIAREVETEFARAEAASFITGDGSNKPQGFIKGTPVTTVDASRAAGVLQYVAGGQAAALPTTLDPYIDLVGSLKAGHRAGAVWMMSKSVVHSIRSLRSKPVCRPRSWAMLWQKPRTCRLWPLTPSRWLSATSSPATPSWTWGRLWSSATRTPTSLTRCSIRPSVWAAIWWTAKPSSS